MLIIRRTHEFSFTPAQNPRCCENLILKLSKNFLSVDAREKTKRKKMSDRKDKKKQNSKSSKKDVYNIQSFKY